ncbi:MAG: DUF1993 domain-containing protein [Novosphingobium sp.]
MALTNLLFPTYQQMLRALSGWLDKAEAQMPGDRAEALLSARLAPDMFPLSTQIRFACVQAQEGLYRLRAEPFPPSVEALVDEGRNASEHPGTMAEARARIADTITLVETVGVDTADLPSETPIAHELPNGMIFDLTAEQYARDWAIPQFYFHLMTAYAILRAEGVDLGKADYVVHMFGFLRPGSMPS